MKQSTFDDSEFYIGWQAAAPAGYARRTRRFVAALAVLVALVAWLTVRFQSGFSGGVFEFGKKTVVEGRLVLNPAPFLVVENGQTTDGRALQQQILLLSPGKFGAEKKLFRDPKRIPREGQRLRVTGALIYHDGKTALEILSWQFAETPPAAAAGRSSTALGDVILRGELADPKCLLGVMKPGYGQPHRDCAARCIAGGVPPVLKVAGPSGEAEYYLLAGPHGERLNRALLPYVADGIQLCGRLEQQGDWLVLYADPALLRRIDKQTLSPDARCQ